MTDTLESNKALVRRLVEEGFNAGNLDVVDELVSVDVVTHNAFILDARTGADSVRGGIEMLRGSFPAEDDRVASFLPMSGTNEGDAQRGGATNRRGEIRAFFV